MSVWTLAGCGDSGGKTAGDGGRARAYAEMAANAASERAYVAVTATEIADGLWRVQVRRAAGGDSARYCLGVDMDGFRVGVSDDGYFVHGVSRVSCPRAR